MDGLYTDLRWDGGQCAASWGQTTEEWGVDLGGVKKIHHLFIQHFCKSMLGIIHFKITDSYLKLIDVKLIKTISGNNVGWM